MVGIADKKSETIKFPPCPSCSSQNARAKGLATHGDRSRRKLFCKDCKKQWIENAVRIRHYTITDYRQWEHLKAEGKNLKDIAKTLRIPLPTIIDYFRRKRLFQS